MVEMVTMPPTSPVYVSTHYVLIYTVGTEVWAECAGKSAERECRSTFYLFFVQHRDADLPLYQRATSQTA